MVKELILTKSQHPQNPEEAFYLGVWALPQEMLENGLATSERVLHYHWSDTQKMATDSLYLINFATKINTALSLKLNEIHGTNFKPEHWLSILGYWLQVAVTAIFDRYQSLLGASEILEAQSFLPTKFDCNVTCPSSDDFLQRTSESDLFNLKLFRLILKESKISSIKMVQHQKVSLVSETPTDSSPSPKKELLKKIYNLAFRFINKKQRILFLNPYISNWNFVKLAFLLRHIPVKSPIQAVGSRANENQEPRYWKLENWESNNEFERIFINLLPKLLPVSMLESYDKISQLGREIYGSTKNRTLITSNLQFYNDIFQNFMCQARNDNSKLVVLEHGGASLNKFNACANLQVELSDLFLTTGTISRGVAPNVSVVGNFRPLGGPKKNKCYAAGVQKNLYVLGGMPRYAFHQRSMAMSALYEGYIKDQVKFLGSLDRKTLQMLTVRFNPLDSGWGVKNRLIRQFPEIKTSPKSTYRMLIENCRLFVATYNATTYLDALGLHIPLIMFWDEDVWPMTPKMKNIITGLKEQKVFHSSPESAAQHFQTVVEEPRQWWETPSVREIVSEFREISIGNPPSMRSLAKLITDV